MKYVSPALRSVVYPALYKTHCLRPRGRAGQLSIVTYHGVRPEGYISSDRELDGGLVDAEAFRAQLRLLKKRYHIISPEHFRQWLRGQESLPPLSVLLTCDDGLRNDLTDMLPILLKEDLRCLFFVTGRSASESRRMLWYEELYLLFREAAPGRFEAACGEISLVYDLGPRVHRRSIWWNAVKQMSELDASSRERILQAARIHCAREPGPEFEQHEASLRRFELLTAAELRQLDSAGMTIGAHTMTHPLLSVMPQESAFREISESKVALESVLHKPVWAIAYPFGNADSITRDVLQMPQAAGFEAAFLNFGGGFRAELPIFALPRIHVTAEMEIAEFEAHVSGFHERIQRLAGRGLSPPAA